MRPPRPYPEAITEIHGRALPEAAVPAGYAALIAAYDLKTTLPRTMAATGIRHRTKTVDGWRILTPRHRPAATLEGHLTFALKYEGVDLAVLKALFAVLEPEAVTTMVRAKPTGRYVRRIWLFYEWMTGQVLDLPDLRRGSYVSALDPALQYAGIAVNSARHRVRNNLPGTPAFCPLVFRTAALERFCAMGLSALAASTAAAVSGDHRPMFEHITARSEGLPSAQDLAQALPEACGQDFLKRSGAGFDPVIAASCLTFGIARRRGGCQAQTVEPHQIVHHVLSRRGFGFPGIMLPVSQALLQRIEEYRRLMGQAEDTFFDATPHAEFLYEIIQVTIEKALPDAAGFVARFHLFHEECARRHGLDIRVIGLLFEKLWQNGSTLPRERLARRRCKLTPAIIEELEEIFRQTARALHCDQTVTRTLRNDTPNLRSDANHRA